jgi:hypothetical protein
MTGFSVLNTELNDAQLPKGSATLTVPPQRLEVKQTERTSYFMFLSDVKCQDSIPALKKDLGHASGLSWLYYTLAFHIFPTSFCIQAIFRGIYL